MQCPMKTSEGNETLIAYGARTMTPEAEMDFARHMSACASCLEMAEHQTFGRQIRNHGLRLRTSVQAEGRRQRLVYERLPELRTAMRQFVTP